MSSNQILLANIAASKALTDWHEAKDKLDCMTRGCRGYRAQKALVQQLAKDYQSAEAARRAAKQA